MMAWAFSKSANHRENLVDRRLVKHQTGKRQIVVVMGELGGSTLAPGPAFVPPCLPTPPSR
jgi:hypothetical protein